MNTKQHLCLHFVKFGLRGVAKFKNKLDLREIISSVVTKFVYHNFFVSQICYHIDRLDLIDSDVDASVEPIY